LFYHLLKNWVKFTLFLSCKRITLHHAALFRHEGPLLIAAHHPNSFFDAILVGAYMKKPVHFLTRSDVFRNGLVRFVLRRLQMIPVYRIRDGKDKLSLNESSFRQSRHALRKGRHVLIFAEGFCNHQTTLQPLKKGAARILLQSWMEGVPVQMMPFWIRYDSFTDFAKEIDLMAGDPFDATILPVVEEHAGSLQLINKRLADSLLALSQLKPAPVQRCKRNPWILPFALAGFLLHAPFYYLADLFARKINKRSIHYDSLLYVFMALFYPFWLLLLGYVGWIAGGCWFSLLLVLLSPVTAKLFVLWK
jgi:1-acyl-sn-glycerol-3-phosphate acyltransferase